MRVKRKWLVWGGVLVLLALSPLLYSIASYALATHQYEKLVARKPLSKSDVEALLFLCSAKRIEITNSLWGKHVALAPGDYCCEYDVLRRDPITVIYDSQGKVKKIFPSFE
jgi:hypothetical protein